ncbi:MAG: hypothetical protein E5X90_06700, partial [Mesorhizobium sp.]
MVFAATDAAARRPAAATLVFAQQCQGGWHPPIKFPLDTTYFRRTSPVREISRRQMANCGRNGSFDVHLKTICIIALALLVVGCAGR